ncbi:Salicylate hydroxylase (Salicylate 1-monooxygenase) [Scheffersomyces stipitis CBS 6054]|uniref:Salicylate hydroxylase (Salicylate 1-monooxygenase) n=1 Tax=Scheffersomyces stipitis (strain ATCC 58785 / CBS 6054 / NBRC 10063 / NRRL Y-11545) TaxID=322104 RepID=A3GH97_PICST|nr:Salicylate hydroxylase (Salicylate 1-monooxygenase) [Scheffersomyces stipitis CBS 6054]EAZ62777.1 Salicylate hydroxylase (Salicylate 1-monooxygenase) [Scheffersomyces stipitis CBS 6054]
MTAGEEPFDIAVIGSGLAGTFATIALSHLPNVKITSYEKTDAPKEVGAWISLTNATFDVLSNFVDINSLNRIAFKGDTNNEYLTRHWKTGEVIFRQPTFNRPRPFVEARTHRIPLHDLLLSYVPPDVIHYSHDVKNLSLQSDGTIINFTDGTSSRKHDLVVVADGIYSRIRRQFYPDGKIKYKGLVAYRSVFPASLVSHLEVKEDTSVWVKDGTVIFLSRLGLDQYGIVAILSEPESTASQLSWDKSTGNWGKHRLVEHFAEWDPYINDVIKSIPEIRAYPLEQAPWLSNLVIEDKIVFIGDAGHPTSGIYGSGASFGFSDVWALYRALQETSSNYWIKNNTPTFKYNAKLALFLFNETRRYFLQRVEQQVSIDSQVKRENLTEIDDKEWTDRYLIVRAGGDWIRSHNVELEFQKVRDQYLNLLQKNVTSFKTSGKGLSTLDLPKL